MTWAPTSSRGRRPSCCCSRCYCQEAEKRKGETEPGLKQLPFTQNVTTLGRFGFLLSHRSTRTADKTRFRKGLAVLNVRSKTLEIWDFDIQHIIQYMQLSLQFKNNCFVFILILTYVTFSSFIFYACKQQLLTAVYSTNSNIRYNKILTNLGVDQPISVSWAPASYFFWPQHVSSLHVFFSPSSLWTRDWSRGGWSDGWDGDGRAWGKGKFLNA